jgi:ER-derived vesicles protein
MFRQQANTDYPETPQYTHRIEPPAFSQSRPLGKMRQVTSKFEDFFMTSLKPYIPQLLPWRLTPGRRYLPAVGRFLIVVTFLEDGWRIFAQYGDQVEYLERYRKYFPWPLAHLFLVANVCVLLCPEIGV